MIFDQVGLDQKIVFQAQHLKGGITIPPSKSQTMRSLIFALLAKGKSVIYNYLHSSDTQSMISACRLLGADVQAYPDRLEVEGNFSSTQHPIDAGNSGQILRFIGAITALLPTSTLITGDRSICERRPVMPLLSGLRQLGAFAVCANNNQHAPIIVRGPLKGGFASIDGQDSQPVSGLLIAAAFSEYPTTLYVQNPGETPWVELTLSWLERFGIDYQREKFQSYQIQGKNTIPGFTYWVPGDWSSAAYPLAAAIVTQSCLTIHGVDFQDRQGDKQLVFVLQEMGANLQIDLDKKTVTYFPGKTLRGIPININSMIDAITILPVIACFAEGTTKITGAAIARYKESDRLHSICLELKKMAADIEENEDGLTIKRSSLIGTQVDSYHDHRMALSLAVAGLGAKGRTQIHGVQMIRKSFPDFFEQLICCGAKIE